MKNLTDESIDQLLTESGDTWRAELRLDSRLTDMRMLESRRVKAGIRGVLSTTLSLSVLAVVLILGIGNRLVVPPGTPPAGASVVGASPRSKTPTSGSGFQTPSAPTVPALVRVGDFVEARGKLIHQLGQPLVLCSGVVETEVGIGCIGTSSFFVSDLEPALIPGFEQRPTWVSPELLLRGTWAGDRLASAEFVSISETPESGRDPAPCSPPDGGWNGDPDVGAEAAAANHLEGVLAGQPERYAEPWLARSETGSHIMVVGTTGDVEAAESDLSDVYPFNLCVHRVDFSRMELHSVADRLDLPHHAWLEVDNTIDRVVVTTTVFDQAVADAVTPFGRVVSVRPMAERIP